jgi:hypothetical protein
MRDHVNRIDDNQLTKIAKNGKLNTSRLSMAFEMLERKLNINITREQAHRIKYRT